MYTPLKEATHQAIPRCKEQKCNLLKKKISNYGCATALVAAFRSVYGSFQMATNIHTRRLTAKTSGSEIRTKALGQSLPDPSGKEYLCRGGKPRCSMHNECGASWEEVDRTWGQEWRTVLLVFWASHLYHHHPFWLILEMKWWYMGGGGGRGGLRLHTSSESWYDHLITITIIIINCTIIIMIQVIQERKEKRGRTQGWTRFTPHHQSLPFVSPGLIIIIIIVIVIIVIKWGSFISWWISGF